MSFWPWKKREEGSGEIDELFEYGFVPAYDSETEAMARWPSKYLYSVPCAIGVDAGESRIRTWLRGNSGRRAVLVFLGHGVSDALLTDKHLSDRRRELQGKEHGVLFSREDATAEMPMLQVIAWACDAGGGLGVEVNEMKGCSFIGFMDKLGFVYGDDAVEVVWGTIVGELIERVRAGQTVSDADRVWLRDRLMAARAAVLSGASECGLYRRIQSTLLLRAAHIVANGKGDALS